MTPQFVLSASYGNDSIAMLRWAYEQKLTNVSVIYCDTGWAAEGWLDRVSAGEMVAEAYGFTPVRLASEGFEALVKAKKAFPRQGIQFCTERLKIEPAQRWLKENDPDRQATVLVGKRREESANRADTPEFVLYSPLHEGRRLWHPLFNMLGPERDALIRRAGFDPLPHRSMECFPCINSNRADLRQLSQDEQRVAFIENLEKEMGHTSKGKPRTMFRPYRYMGATGIREILRWAQSDPGQFDLDDGTGGGGCYSGQCGL
jgi:3'-phosphoadenosine 5'-phosphosulfate sulfotransferase (PAPS reductase)/FAD synthetase